MVKKATAQQVANQNAKAHSARVRSNEDAVLAKNAKLDPNDKSEGAEYTREVAEDIRDRRDRH